MKKAFILLHCLLTLAIYTSTAQTARNIDNATDVNRGRFAYALNEREQVQVSYSLAPLHPGAAAHFMIHTPDPMPFRATITNNKGKVVYNWTPQQLVHLYEADWNLSGLKAGDYTVNIFLGSDNTRVHYFSFQKS